MATVTFQDLRDINLRYDIGAGMDSLKKASGVVELFEGDGLVAILFVMADGYAISVGRNLPQKRTTWRSAALEQRYGLQSGRTT